MKCKCGYDMVKNGYQKERQNWRCMACGKSTSENVWKKHLDEKERELCLSMVNGGASFQATGDAFGVTRQTIGNIVKKNKSL